MSAPATTDEKRPTLAGFLAGEPLRYQAFSGVTCTAEWRKLHANDPMKSLRIWTNDRITWTEFMSEGEAATTYHNATKELP